MSDWRDGLSLEDPPATSMLAVSSTAESGVESLLISSFGIFHLSKMELSARQGAAQLARRLIASCKAAVGLDVENGRLKAKIARWQKVTGIPSPEDADWGQDEYIQKQIKERVESETFRLREEVKYLNKEVICWMAEADYYSRQVESWRAATNCVLPDNAKEKIEHLEEKRKKLQYYKDKSRRLESKIVELTKGIAALLEDYE